jgi:NAD(P)-dependent dehydrogenase (short-subunit alcohol dehydrogenase family)
MRFDVRSSNLHPLDGQVALVTGASGGIGEGIARALGACGVRLGLVGRRPEALGTVAQAIGSDSPSVKSYVCELSDETQVQGLARRVQKDFGGVDILIHSAGVFGQERIDATSEAGFDRQYRVNLRAPHSLTRELARSLRARRGQVVFINSSITRGARAGLGQYAATKAGLKAVADCLREELNPEGVRVLSVYVGRTATPMQKAIFEQEAREYIPERLLQPSDVGAVVISCLSLPRTAEVTEIDVRPMMKI